MVTEEFIFQTTAVSSSSGPHTEKTICGLSGEVSFQQVLSGEQDFLLQYQDSTPSTSKDALALRDSEAQMNQQQWSLSEDAAPAGPGASLPSNSSQAEELLPLHCPPSPTMAAAICLMVEDPYFDSEEAPQDPSEDWRGSRGFNIPAVHVNDQDPELNAAPAGKRSHLKISRASFSHAHRGACHRCRRQRRGDTSSAAPTNPGILHPRRRCRLVLVWSGPGTLAEPRGFWNHQKQ